jgi:hypothetical protein
MEAHAMTEGKTNAFGRLGRLITKRRYAIIGAWILLLAVILPVVLTATGVTSLTMESSTDSSLESSKAADIISAQFQKSVSNDSLIIIISTRDASSLATQRFIDELTNAINSSSKITGIENITSVYTILIPALNQTNEGVYTAYNGANLTYNLLYGVPTIYSNVWHAAYNETKNSQLVPGLNQTNQAVYAVFDNANVTYNFLYGLPAAYSGVWSAAYSQTHDQLVDGLTQANQGVNAAFENANLTYHLLYGAPAIYLDAWLTAIQTNTVSDANQIAYQTTAAALQQADPEAFAQYTSPLLDIFHAAWTQSFTADPDPSSDPVQRATAASNQVNQQYINTFLAGNETAQQFVTALTSTLTFQDYLNNVNNQEQNNIALAGFAVQTVVAASGGASSTEFVTAAYNLGVNPSAEALCSLADAVIANPTAYSMGTDFISTFNEVAYTQTEAILSSSVPAEYAPYTSQLLYAFNATWAGTFQEPQTQALPPTVRASLAANITIQGYIDTALAGNATMQHFVSALTKTFSLDT